jgi:hypothetical protein
MGSATDEENEKKYPPDSDECRLAELLLHLILETKPDFRRPDLQRWAGNKTRQRDHANGLACRRGDGA